MQTKETRGLVLYNRQFREDDKLVKIFTETSGKHMFFVRHATNSKLSSVIQPLILADFILKINNHGLSYIEDYKGVSLFKEINADIYKLAYATYLVSLADAAISDAVYDAPLFAFLIKTLELMDEGLDYEILTNIFEIQILDRFGVQLNFHDCVFCHRVGLAFDFSHRYSGLLCPEHYEKDLYRSHLDPNVPYLLNQFQTLHFDSLKTISVKPDMKQKLRKFIDEVYEDYIGLRLKSKKFIDDLDHWGQVMK
ncbi:DNA repair protein RecO [Streptococcus mutans]|jgi:DNA repair protein recO|uniref:DNA repair protein RecO n=1 Tax=Streptococcus mutans TaxID=1309 RepID=UPI000308A94F|nr:DNA repair protein RecO [Streptococcus mutans]MCB4949132.1 DNA repair protein RecO [Streptococcus mutans]MCB4959987.1 DNA repair protein RecO [Streptococcus mutans]MCB4972123.1 DNA repair protein RecO [Streptococcus mutans]MCB4973826.1 DNA repair protein RecO [Streptococcus mutans]MCB5001593.1 DNA repair protein RecO [Streptococcus mutans]